MSDVKRSLQTNICCNVLGCSKCGGLHSWLRTLCSYKCRYVNYRNISFSANIEYACFNCTGKFAENGLRIFPHFHVDFSLPMWPLLSKPLYISMRRRKMYFCSTQSNKKSVNLGILPVFDVGTKHIVKIIPIYLFGNMKEIIWKKFGKVKNLYGTCEGISKKNEKHIWKNAEFAWTSERIYMETWRIRLDKRKKLYGPTVF